MEVACPQCGNPNLDVDEQNSVVYCRRCGFAVRVDPQTGNVTPISESPAEGQMEAPSAYEGRRILGTDPLTFFLGATTLLLFLTFINQITWGWFMLLESLVLVYWWYNR